jgi:hypothetical protein
MGIAYGVIMDVIFAALQGDNIKLPGFFVD